MAAIAAPRNERPRHSALSIAASANLRRQNFTETDDSYYIDVPTPGFGREEMQLQVLHHQRMLTLNGERSGAHPTTQIRSKLARRWRLPLQADAAQVHAALRDGVLRVSFARCNAITNVVNVVIE